MKKALVLMDYLDGDINVYKRFSTYLRENENLDDCHFLNHPGLVDVSNYLSLYETIAQRIIDNMEVIVSCSDDISKIFIGTVIIDQATNHSHLIGQCMKKYLRFVKTIKQSDILCPYKNNVFFVVMVHNPDEKKNILKIMQFGGEEKCYWSTLIKKFSTTLKKIFVTNGLNL